jgi:hypothetical protein
MPITNKSCHHGLNKLRLLPAHLAVDDPRAAAAAHRTTATVSSGRNRRMPPRPSPPGHLPPLPGQQDQAPPVTRRAGPTADEALPSPHQTANIRGGRGAEGKTKLERPGPRKTTHGGVPCRRHWHVRPCKPHNKHHSETRAERSDAAHAPACLLLLLLLASLAAS